MISNLINTYFIILKMMEGPVMLTPFTGVTSSMLFVQLA